MLNLEELGARLREFGETIPEQKLYKFDNYTDTVCLEPEYGASKVMVETFADWPGRYLLLYTKSDNVEHLLDLSHNGHTLISWSLSGPTVAEKIEKRTPRVADRITAMAQCEQAGYAVRARISPICPVQGWREEYAATIDDLLARVHPEVITIDALGWMQPQQMAEALDVSLFEKAYADEARRMLDEGVEVKGKHFFSHAMRAEILRFVIEEIHRRRPGVPVSLCMETPEMWRELGDLVQMAPGDYVCTCGPTSVPGHPMMAS